jgi:hypothetical protein
VQALSQTAVGSRAIVGDHLEAITKKTTEATSQERRDEMQVEQARQPKKYIACQVFRPNNSRQGIQLVRSDGRRGGVGTNASQSLGAGYQGRFVEMKMS